MTISKGRIPNYYRFGRKYSKGKINTNETSLKLDLQKINIKKMRINFNIKVDILLIYKINEVKDIVYQEYNLVYCI